MDHFGWMQLTLFIGLLLLFTKPMGIYLSQVLETDGKTWLDPVLRPIERGCYWLMRVDPKREQNWKEYIFALLAFDLVGVLFSYALLRCQHLLPLNPENFGPVPDHLAFNTAISFVTQTNWQSYAGEATLSYLSQMVGLVFHHFASAAVALTVATALVRGIARQSASTLGNFWVTLIRSTLYLLLPLCLIFGIFLVSQGVVQNFQPYQEARVLNPMIWEAGGGPETATDQGTTSLAPLSAQTQTIVQGPIASQVATKLLGSNGGGYTGVNAAHPYENPTPLSNFFQILALLLIPSGLTYYLGIMVHHQKHGWAVWSAMLLLFLAGLLVCWEAEVVGNSRLAALGVENFPGNMEGKEMRFGVFSSALFATATTDTSCGAVNAMHDSFTPLGGLVLLFNLLMGCPVFGGVGVGLFSILIFAILTVFLAGLMVGKTPEYLGKKIEAYDVKASVIYLITSSVGALGFTAWAMMSQWGVEARLNFGPHGFSEIFYSFAQAISTNGSAFAGINANSYWYDTVLGIAIFFGRYFMIVPVMALAGNLVKKNRVAVSGGTFPVSGALFTLLLAGTIVIVGALVFFPALALGPLLEHFLMIRSDILF